MSCLDISIKPQFTIIDYYNKYRAALKVGFFNKSEQSKDLLFSELLKIKYPHCFKCDTTLPCTKTCYTVTKRCTLNITEYTIPLCVSPKKCITIVEIND